MATKVTLRQKPISGNRQSLYLDFYPAIPNPETGKITRREFLNMYLNDEIEVEEQKYFDDNGKEQKRFVPVLDKKGESKKAKLTPLEKEHNKATLQLAEQIRQKRENHINKPEIYTGYEQEQLKIKQKGENNFVEYFKKLADKRKGSNHDNWVSSYAFLETFTNGFLRFADLNESFCNDFKEYLLTSKSKKSDKKTLDQNSASSYFNKFKATLKQAYKDGYLSFDLNVKIEPIKTKEVIKQTLTIEELNTLAKTNCKIPLLKKTGLFMALTGMPYKEMQNLTWGNVEVSKLFGIRIKMYRDKTDKPYLINISKQAYNLLGEPKEPNDKVFKDLDDQIRYYYFPKWLKDAGIKKKMTFHDLRHSYGTLQIDLGTDPYTLQGNMGHATPRQTMQYGKISDQRKREAVERIKIDL